MDGVARSFPSKILSAVAALGLLAAACGPGPEKGSVRRGDERVLSRQDLKPVLRIEDLEFTNFDFRTHIENSGVESASDLPEESLSRLFDRFVDEKILLAAALQRNISLSEDEKREYLARLATGSEAGQGAGARSAVPPERQFERLLVEKYTYTLIRDIQVDDAEIEESYERNKRDYLVPERVQVSQILVDTEEKAVSVLRRLERTGEAEYRKIAREESMGPEASRDGVMGVFKPGDLPADMERVIFSLSEGRTSLVVESAYGFHVFRLDKKFPPALRPLGEAAPAVRSRLLTQKIKEAVAAHLEGLKDALTWQTLPENLFFRYQRSNG